jgi:hypothetical protein
MILVHDDRLDIVHIEGEGVAEQKDEKQRDREGKGETPVIPDQVIDLFAHDGLDLPGVHELILSIYFLKIFMMVYISR